MAKKGWSQLTSIPALEQLICSKNVIDSFDTRGLKKIRLATHVWSYICFFITQSEYLGFQFKNREQKSINIPIQKCFIGSKKKDWKNKWIRIKKNANPSMKTPKNLDHSVTQQTYMKVFVEHSPVHFLILLSVCWCSVYVRKTETCEAETELISEKALFSLAYEIAVVKIECD